MSPQSQSENTPWPQRTIESLGLVVGPCAWRASMLAGGTAHATQQERDEAVAYVNAHPSLVLVEPQDDQAVLDQVARLAATIPVMLCMNEPDFVRRFDAQVRTRIAALQCQKVAGVILYVEELSDLKSGGLLHTLFSLREEGVIDHVGVAAQDARGAEWLSPQTAARVLTLPYSLEDQSARYRALPIAADMEQLCIASHTVPDPNDHDALAFALGEADRVLPVLDRPLPAQWRAMNASEVDAAWHKYQSNHTAPPRLPRSHAPE